MRRRDFLKVTGSAAAIGGVLVGGTTGVATAVDAQPSTCSPATRRVRLTTPWPDATHGPGDHVRRFAARLDRALGERWQIDVSVGAPTTLAGCHMHIGHATDALPDEPAAAFFDGLPAFTGLDADGLAAWSSTSGGQELFDGLAARHGVKPLLVGHTGAPHSLWSREPLTRPEDFAGRRVAVRGLARRVVEALGATAVVVPPGAIATALTDGAIDIAEAPDASLATRVALAASGARGYVSPLNPDGHAIVCQVPLDLWWTFSNAERIVLAAVAAEAFAAHRDELLAEEPLTRALIGHVPRLAAVPTGLTAATSRIATDVVSRLATGCPLTRRISAEFIAFRDHHRRRDSFMVG